MNEPLIDVRDLKTWFPVRRGLMQRVRDHVHAVDGVSFSISKGETLALVGESGCGKTTVGKSLLRLVHPHSGEVRFQGTDVLKLEPGELRRVRQNMQMIFQDPANSLNPRMLIRDIVAEGIRSFGLQKDGKTIEQMVSETLGQVELDADAMYRYPHEFSGGQRQRICIARALAVEPSFIVCDEATSALDVSVQASILNLLNALQKNLGLTYLFITHDLSVVEYLADRVAVMYLGQIVEESDSKELFANPKHPYTKALLQSAPRIGAERHGLVELGGEVPSPMAPPAGCRFHTRCAERFDPCDRDDVPMYEVTGGRCRCFLHRDSGA